MLMRRWSPTSEVPTTFDHNGGSQNLRTCLRCCKVIISAFILVALVSFCIVYTLQKETFFNGEYQRSRQDQLEQQQRSAFDTYIQDISDVLLRISDKNSTDEKYLDHIRTKTLLILRTLDVKRKKDIILFLHERNLLQNNQLDLHGADLNNIELTCPHDFHYLHLSGVFWSNAVFINCQLTSAVFDQAYMINARFINSTLRNASFIQTNLDNSQFIQTIIIYADFSKASLIQADFRQAEIVQGNNFTNADLYQAKLTPDQLEGKQVLVIKHDFYHARLPNGSFELINSKKNLIISGDAEMECSANQTKWESINHNIILSTEVNENTASTDNQWGNCLFLISTKNQVYQTIDLHSYSLLIDTDNAGFTFKGFASCDKSYFAIKMYRSDDILHSLKIYPKLDEELKFYGNTTMYAFGVIDDRLAIRTQRIEIYFGVLEPNIDCYFDNIIFTIHQVLIK